MNRCISDSLRNFDELPSSAHVRQPVVESLFSISAATVWRRVRSGLLPRPRKFGRTTAWSVGELRTVLANMKEGAGEAAE